MKRQARMIYYSDKDAGEGMTISNNGLNKVERDGMYGKRSDVDVVIGSIIEKYGEHSTPCSVDNIRPLCGAKEIVRKKVNA